MRWLCRMLPGWLLTVVLALATVAPERTTQPERDYVIGEVAPPTMLPAQPPPTKNSEPVSTQIAEQSPDPVPDAVPPAIESHFTCGIEGPGRSFTVRVVNGTDHRRLGARVTKVIAGTGHDTTQPIDAREPVARTSVQFDGDFDLEAAGVAELLGLPPSSVEPSTTLPRRYTRGAEVTVVLGEDFRLAQATDG